VLEQPDRQRLHSIIRGRPRRQTDVTVPGDNRNERVVLGVYEYAGHSNQVTRNAILRNGSDGLLVGNYTPGTVVERNVASENGGDGITALNLETTLTGNTANKNVNLGIEAVPGVIDGGHNRASGNGNPLQCLNIFCKTNGSRK
jgi:parallel beta-helix repeat protein